MPETELRIAERQHLHLGEDLPGYGLLDESLFQALIRHNERLGGQVFEVRHRHLRVRNMVGSMRCGRLTLDIVPKLADTVEDLDRWHKLMLSMLFEARRLPVQTHEALEVAVRDASLLDVLIRLFLEHVERLVHQGLVRCYRPETGNLPVFRGQLVTARHIALNHSQRQRSYTRHTVYDHQHRFNRILLAALRALRDSPPGLRYRDRVQGLLLRFPEGLEPRFKARELAVSRFDRKTARYREAIGLARLILEHLMPELISGMTESVGLMFNMEQLFERYVASRLSRAFRGRANVQAQRSRRFWKSTAGPWKALRPDILIEWPDGRRVVVDTKWKQLRGGMPGDADLKQMFVYNERFKTTRAVLLYPADSRVLTSFQGAYFDNRHTCDMATWPLFAGDAGEQCAEWLERAG